MFVNLLLVCLIIPLNARNLCLLTVTVGIQCKSIVMQDFYSSVLTELTQLSK
jgi:hypothetical protein